MRLFARHSKPLRWVSLLLLAGALTSTAHAHLVVQGLDEVGNGALHPLVTPAQVLIIFSLSFFLGQQIPFNLKAPVIALATTSAAALLITTTSWIPVIHQPIMIGIALCAATLVTINRKVPTWVPWLLCAIAGIGIGLDSRVEEGAPYAIAKTLFGTWIALNTMVPYIALCASHGAGRPWAITGIRIAGSWIIAISLLVLAFSLRH